MSHSSDRHRQSRIETFEDLILMSASGADVDMDLPEPGDAQLTLSEIVDESFSVEPDSLLALANESRTDPSLTDLPAPIAADEERMAESGLTEGESEDLNEDLGEIDELPLTDEFEFASPPLEDQSESAPAAEGSLEASSEISQLAAAGAPLSINSAANATDSSDALNDAAGETAAPYSQRIVLNGEDNDAIFEDNGNLLDDLVQIRSANGTFETIVFRLPTNVLTIELGDGNDSLAFEGQEPGAISADVFIHGQGGNDTVRLNSLETLNNVVVEDLDGNNNIYSDRFNIGGNLSISDGDGDQMIFVGGRVNGDFDIANTSGDSRLELGSTGGQRGSANIGGSVTINNGGIGSDYVSFRGFIDGDFDIDAGEGNFELRSIFSNVHGSLSTNVDKGNSTIFLGDLLVGNGTYFTSGEGDTDTVLAQSTFRNGITINNGTGFDELQFFNAIISGEDSPGSLDVFNGDGGSSTRVIEFGAYSLRIDSIRIRNGAGIDTIELSLPSAESGTLNNFFADNGDGDAMVEITGSNTVKSVTLISGEGADSILLDGINIENELVIDTGDGGRSLDIQNSEIGKTEIRGATGSEIVFGDSDDEIFASLGNNVIDGGAGDDVLYVYQGTSSDFDIRYEEDGRVIVEGPGLNGTTVRNTLTNVERISFNDKVVYLEDLNGEDPPTTLGTDGDDWIGVPENGGNVEAGDGDDSIYAPLGDNVINGGAGDDVLVVYEGSSADFDIRYEDDGRVIVEGPGLNGTTVRNTLTNVERISFNDKVVYLEDLNGEDPPTTLGTDGDDWIGVPERGGTVEAGDGDDSIHAPLGDNVINGGAGDDVLVVYEGSSADFDIRYEDDGRVIVEGPGLNGSTVINRLTDVEYIQFNDQRVKLADLEFATV